MSKKRGTKPKPVEARRNSVNAKTEQLVGLAENWNARALHDAAASQGGINAADRLAIQKVTKRKTQRKKPKGGK